MESPPKPLNDPRDVDYGPAREAVVRSEGGTPSERYLAKLADKTFLNLWAYPNVFIDKKRGGKGDGKELCDLLVVCGEHVLIFSDKSVAWPGGDNITLAWQRWARRAIAKSVAQIRGAERWIEQFPNRIYIDRQCTRKLPIALPPPERRKVHGIIVALGAGEACKEYFGGGIGSLMVNPSVVGDAHWEGDGVLPFTVGDLDPTGSFVHVLDDATLDIVLGELDTITDFTAYLAKKERFIRSEQLISAGGEEDLVAYYMTHMNPQREHDFTRPDGSPLGADEHVTFEPGLYEDMLQNPQYRAKKQEDADSYVWDRLIQQFTDHMLAGTTVVPDGEPFDIGEMEQAIRHMALVPRYLRRIKGKAILDALEQGRKADRFTRAILPGPTEPNQETGFFFMTLARPKFELNGGYEQYRAVRRNMLQAYAMAFLEKNRRLTRMVGIATEPPSAGQGASEDLLVIEGIVWTEKLSADLEERKEAFNIMKAGNFTEYPVQGKEFPDASRRGPKV